MSDINYQERKTNWLLALSLERPVLVMLVLFILACLIKILDVFILRLDEQLGEAILTKGLGFVLVAAYVWICGRKLSDIGFHTRNLGKSLLISSLGFVILYIMAYGVQLIFLRSSGEEASYMLSAVDPKTGMSGGIWFAVWLLMANLVNSAMEEGLFRGLMIRHFLIRFSGWGAILLQTVFFATWHMNWPIRLYLDGQASFSQAGFEALTLLVGTSLAAVVLGFLYLKTDNLWGPFLAHTINNGIFNVLFIKTNAGMQSGLEFGPFLAIFLIGYVLLIPVLYFVTKYMGTPEVKPWGEFDKIVVAAPEPA